MCNYGGNLPTTNPYAVACCSPGDSHEYCQRSESNTCSPIYNEAKHNYFTYCPLINSTGCGLSNTKSDDMTIEASTKPSTFIFDQLRWKKAEFKFTSVDVCYYQVQNPTYYYSSGKVFIEFKTAEEGVELYLNAGGNVTNSSMAMVEYNRTVELNKKYEIDQSINYIVTAVPKYNNYNTSFSFEYSTDGVEYPWYELFYYQWFLKHPNGMTMLYIAGALAVLLVCLLMCCIYVGIRKCCCKKKTKVDPFGANLELTASNYLRNKDGKDDDDETNKNMEVLDIEDDYESGVLGNTDLEGPVIAKVSKAKHEKDIKEAYVNPFKPENIKKNQEKQNAQ